MPKIINGSGNRLMATLLSASLAGLGGLGLWAFQSLDSRIAAHAAEEGHAGTRERLSSVEAEIGNLKHQVDQLDDTIKDSQDDIDGKFDAILNAVRDRNQDRRTQ